MNLIGAPPLDYTRDGRRSNGRELVRISRVVTFGDNANSLFAEYQFEVFTKLPGVGVPEDSGAGQTGVYWYPTYSEQLPDIFPVCFQLKLRAQVA